MKFLLAVFCICALSFAVFAQSVVITPKKTVYTRKIRGVEKEKRTFDVRYPVVSGAISPAVKKNLNDAISYWRVFEISLKDSLTEDTSLSSLDYRVNYNKNGVLDISLIQETVAAYPDTHTVNLVIDLKTGKPVSFNNVFAADSRAKLAGLVDSKLQVEKNNIIGRINKGEFAEKDENTDASKVFREDVENLKFTPENFNEFSVNDKGVTILYDAGFPHVIHALQPDGRYFFTWTQIKPFIRRDGLLAKFVR